MLNSIQSRLTLAFLGLAVVLRGTRFDPPGVDGVQTGLRGQQSVLVSRIIHFGDRHFHIFVKGPVSEALAPADNTVRIMLTIAIIALLAAGGLGFLLVPYSGHQRSRDNTTTGDMES